MSANKQDFRALLEQIGTLLESEQRLSYRGLKRQFNLNDDDLEDIKDELIYARQIARDEDSKVLVWIGNTNTQSRPASSRPRGEMQGEKKQVTLLFCDIVESMPLGEQLGLEGWHDAINEFYDLLARAVQDHHGTPSKFTGDGIMAIFGAPIAVEDHALRACMAALRIREDLTAWNEQIRQKYNTEFKIRVGVNTGEAVVGTIGDPAKNEYTANGNAVGIAARLEAKASTNQILISESCAHEVNGLCRLIPVGAHDIKGVSRPIELYALDSVLAEANRFDVARSRGLTRFVGRSREMAALHTALQKSQSGQGQIIGIEAEAGTGKSRLAYEFLENCRSQGMTILQGHAVSHGQNIPMLPMLQVFRGYWGISSRDDDETAREAVCLRLLRMRPEFQEMLPVLYELLGISDPNMPAPRIDPDAKQRQLLSLLRQIVEGADPETGNIVTCIEDLHWLDATSEAFLNEWANAMPNSNTLLMVSFRPGYHADWMDAPNYQQLNLAPLSVDEVHTLLSDLIGDDPSTTGLVDEIINRTGGNPFFCEEIVQSLRESGDLTQVAVRYELHRPINELFIPASVHSVLAARIDRLHADDKATLQTAAVIGREFSLPLLMHVSDQSDEFVTSSLGRLKQNDYIFERNQDGEKSYLFKHALTQEVALDSQLVNKRQKIHARVAAGMEALHANKPDEVAALAAYHWEQARQNMPAAAAYCRAAVHESKSNRQQGMGYIQKALALTNDEPFSEARCQIRLQALAELIAGGAWRFNMSDEDLETLSAEARALAEGAGLTDLALLLRSGHCAALGMMRGDVRRHGELIDEMVADLNGASAEIEAALMGNHAYNLYARGDLKLGLSQAWHGIELSNGDVSFGQASGYSALVTCQNMVVLHAAAMGDFESALEANRNGIALSLENGLTEELIWHQSNFSEVICAMGEQASDAQIADALTTANKACELAEQVASDYTRGVAKRSRAIALLLCGQYAEAETATLDCLEHCRERRAHLEVEARVLALLAATQHGLGNFSQSLETANHAVARAQEQGTAFFECLALVQVARNLVQLDAEGHAEEITDVLDQADRIIETTGATSQTPHIEQLRNLLLAA